ncbi:FAD-dependent thymidylate synthase [Miltoncostaea marina]|uniref:FAD-dependent thymidylate synthase n=1 Tax=Miltoncostaea marina TaxID=2843215 RepID=UPI001C3D9F6B|nr:FAD-dependent thymidylate synthase [Miltoncostaea marina]
MTNVDLDARERERLAPFVTDTTGPVFALTGLPEVVKGALFARYSRSPKSLRRLLLDEFMPGDGGPAAPAAEVGSERAEALYGRVLAEYGDDSVAQLGAAHLAVEGASNLLTKVLQWGRLASYLEQSTRYIAFTDRPGGRYRYHRPPAVLAHPELGPAYTAALDAAFEGYAALLPRLVEHVAAGVPDDPGTPPAARERAVRAKALDLLRGLLPAATTANVGIFASGQAYEAMIVRMAAHPLPEARDCAAAMLRELRKVIPAFLTRVDRPDRGVAHGEYLAGVDRAAAELADRLLGDPAHAPAGASVRLVDFDPDGEARVLAHALWPAGGRPLADVRSRVLALDPPARAAALAEWAGERGDRRQRPGRALEATTYTFDVVCDYGAYRDLQRHRMLTLQAQPLTPRLGYDVPDEVAAAGGAGAYAAVQARCTELHDALTGPFPHEAAYAVTLAHRIRFTMTMNAREAMHLVELRSQPQGHESYRAVAREMHRQIAEVAGHRAIAAMMTFVDASDPAAGRLAAERRLEARRARP